MSEARNRITVRKTTVTHRGKGFTVFEPLKPLDHLYLVSERRLSRQLFGYPSSLRKLSLLASLSAKHPEAVVHVRIHSTRPTYLDFLPDDSLHIALCHHSLQLRYSDWKDIRSKLANWRPTTLRIPDPAVEVECEGQHWQKRDADILDFKEAAHTEFVIGSQPVLAFFAHKLYCLSTVSDNYDDDFRMLGLCRQRKFAPGDDDLIVASVSKNYRP